MAKKSSDQLNEDIAALVETMRERAIDETRRDVADGIRDNFLDRSATRVIYDDTPDDSITDSLAGVAAGEIGRGVSASQRSQLTTVAKRFADDGVSDDFRAALVFAAALIGDTRWEL